jgi:arylformamidase
LSKIYDITPLISKELGVFPGDISFQRKISMDFKSGEHLLLSAIETTLHLGAHADSTSHYHKDGLGVEHRPLTSYFGKVQVIKVDRKPNERIQLKAIESEKIKAPRVLFCTNSFPDPNQWNSDFMSLSPEVIEWLHGQGVVLVGLDTPSVDPESSKRLESHQALYRAKMAVLEGLVLKHVPEGVYSLVALPLPIQDGDASPVRALLFEDPELFENYQSPQIQSAKI